MSDHIKMKRRLLCFETLGACGGSVEVDLDGEIIFDLDFPDNDGSFMLSASDAVKLRDFLNEITPDND